jgi:hypothetical protein
MIDDRTARNLETLLNLYPGVHDARVYPEETGEVFILFGCNSFDSLKALSINATFSNLGIEVTPVTHRHEDLYFQITIKRDGDSDSPPTSSQIFGIFLTWELEPHGLISPSQAEQILKRWNGSRRFGQVDGICKSIEVENMSRNEAIERVVDAISQHDLREVIRFVKEGGSPESRMANGMRLTHWCAAVNDLRSLKYLLKNGARLDTPGVGGMTELHQAAIQASTQMVRFLLSRGADVSARDRDGRIPSHVSVMVDYGRRNAAVIRALIASGVSIDVQETKSGSTALHNAIAAQCFSNAMLLLDLGARLDICDRRGRTALDLAISDEVINGWVAYSKIGGDKVFSRYGRLLRRLRQAEMK